MATVHQKDNGNYVIEIKIRHIVSKTLINSVKFWGTYKIFKRKRNQKHTQIYRLTKAVKKGDFIAYDRTGDGKWDHVAYVTGKSGKKKTIQQRRVYNIQIAQHTRDYCSWLTNVGEEGRKNGWVPHYKKNYKKIRYTILKRI